MQILTHPDPGVLEGELLRLIEREHPAAPASRSLVIVPTTRLAAHVQRRLTQGSGRTAWIGLLVTHFSALAHRILAEAGQETPLLASSRLRERLVRRIVDTAPGNLWYDSVSRRPGTATRLLGALEDLREAGIGPTELLRCCRGKRHADLAFLYDRYARALNQRQGQGRVDDAGLVREALPHAASFAERYEAVVLHGTYDLIGIHIELLREIDRGCKVTVLLPGRHDESAPAFRFADSLRDDLSSSQSPAAPIDAGSADGCDLPLTALYDEEAHPGPLPDGRLVFRHAQGPEAEVQWAVRSALRAIADGCRAEEIAIIARNLGGYASAIEAACADSGLNWTSSLRAPLRRQPVVRDFLLMLQIVVGDFLRRPTAELLASERLRWQRLTEDGRPLHGELAETWSLAAGLVGGLQEWSGDLVRWAAASHARPESTDEERAEARRRARERAVEARRFGRALQLLRRRVDAGPATWPGHATRLRALLDELFVDDVVSPGDPAVAVLNGLLEEMESIELWSGEGEVPISEVRDWLETAVGDETLPTAAEDSGGLRVLDAMQARGLTFERVLLLGLNAGEFPRTPREDPILDDALRGELRKRTGRPLPLKAAGAVEERQLLAMIVGSSRAVTEISWQRADDAGRVRSPSLALRELARLAYGSPDLEQLLWRAVPVPSHPKRWLDELVRGPGVATESEAMLYAALDGYGEIALSTLADRFPCLHDGMSMLRATQAFSIRDGAFDARIGRSRDLSGGLSVSRFGQLGRCPLQFFFESVLRVRPLDDERGIADIDARDVGIQIHGTLERTYATLRDEGLLPGSEIDAMIRRAEEILAVEGRELLGPRGEPLARRLPVLWEEATTSWHDELIAFVRDDLMRIGGQGVKAIELEHERSAELELGAGCTLTLRGRFDRCLFGDGEVRIGDYKTSGNLTAQANPTKMLKGERLQVPLYQLLGGGTASVELLGVGPSFQVGDDAARPSFAGFENEDQQEGFFETLRVLVRLAERQRYPWREGQHCDWCSYAAACRRHHPPSQERELQYEESTNFAALQHKTRRKPRLELEDGADG